MKRKGNPLDHLREIEAGRYQLPTISFFAIVLTLSIAACSPGEPTEDLSDPGEETTAGEIAAEPEGTMVSAALGGEVTSDDGNLTIEIPANALKVDSDITIKILRPEDYPSELESGTLMGEIYDLGPDGLSFNQPVKITRRFSESEVGADFSLGMPIVILFSRDASGEWSTLDDLEVEFEGDGLIASGTTTHFSSSGAATTVHIYGTQVPVELTPPTAERKIGHLIQTEVSYGAPAGIIVTGWKSAEWGMSNPEVLSLYSGEIGYQATYRCDEVGTSDYTVTVEFNFESGVDALVHAMTQDDLSEDREVLLKGKGICKAREPATHQSFIDFVQETQSPFRFDNTDGACGFPNFTDSYVTRFQIVEGELVIELLQRSSGQLVAGAFNLDSLTFDEADSVLESYRNGRVAPDPITGEAVLYADYFHPCPDGEGEQQWTVEAPFNSPLFAPPGILTDSKEGDGTCEPGPNTLCLQNGRFQVEANQTSADGILGIGSAISYDAITGAFAFGESDASEFALKIINACEINDHFWVFTGTSHDLAFQLQITDTQTDQVRRYIGSPISPADAIVDTLAFATCP
jgi:hypothetical protein